MSEITDIISSTDPGPSREPEKNIKPDTNRDK